MSSFSAVNDAMEGFRLIGKRPGAVTVWVAFWMVFALGPMIAGVVLVWPHFAEMISGMHNMDVEGGALFGKIAELQTMLWTMLGPWLLWLMVAQTIINTAVFRAVLEPRSGGLGGLKLGMEEVHQFLLQIILFLLFIAFACLMTMLIGASIMAARSAPDGVGGWVIALAVIVAFCLWVYVPTRLSLAAPMTFARKRIDVFGSWRATRGHFWPLLGMILVVVIFLCAFLLVLEAVRNLALLGFSWSQLQGLDRMGQDPKVLLPALMHAMGPGLIVAVVIQGIAEALMRIIFAAPFAAAYRDLSGRTAETAASAYEAAPAH